MNLSRFVALAAVSSAAGVLCAAGVARAERIATVVRGAGAGSDKAAAFVAHYLRGIFEDDERYDVVDLVETLGDPGADRAKRAFEVAEEMVQKGREAYESLDLDPAVEYLNTALSKYEKFAADTDDPKKIADALMLLGATHILRGEEKTGAKRLAQAIAIFPEVEPDPHVFNPSMRDVFQDAHQKLAARPTGTLSVSSNPSYAEIYLDGRFVGVTPASIENVVEGRHYVRLVKDGYRTWGKLVDVVGGSEATDTGTLKPTSNFDDFESLVDDSFSAMKKQGGSSELPVGDAVDQLGVLLNVDHLLLAQVSLDGERVEVTAVQYNLNKQRGLKSGKQTFAYDSRPEIYQREVGDLYNREFREGSGGAVSDREEQAADDIGLAHAGSEICYGMTCHDFKLLLLAGGGGVGAVFMGVGAIMWNMAGRDHSEYRTTPQASPDAERLRKAGTTKAIVGDVLFFVGAAVATTAAGLYFLWTPAPSAEEVVGGSNSWSFGAAPLPGGGAAMATLRF